MRKMRNFLDTIRSFIGSSASLRSFLLTLGALLSVSGWGQESWVGTNPLWQGSDPLNYYYLKNLSVAKYVCVNPNTEQGQQFALSSIENAIPFSINKYDYSSRNWPTAYSFVENGVTYWLGQNNGNSRKETSWFEWTAVDNYGMYQLQNSNRRLNAWSVDGISVPKTSGNETWIYWNVEPKSTNNDTTEYYLFNVGQHGYLTKTNTNVAGLAQSLSEASKISINKFTSTPLLFYESTNYVYHNKGTNQSFTSPLDFIIYAQNGGYYLYSVKGDNRDRYLNADGTTSCNFPYKDFNDDNRTWLFLTQGEIENAQFDYYLYNVGTGQFLAFHEDEEGNVKTYTTNDPNNASLITVNKGKYSFIKRQSGNYYMYHSSGTNEQHTDNDFYFTISAKTINGISGYQLTTKIKEGWSTPTRYACGGYSGYLNDRSFGPLNFPKDDNIDEDNDLNSLWLFITPDEFNTKNQKLAPVHVPFTYDRYMFYDGEITTEQNSVVWSSDTENEIKLGEGSATDWGERSCVFSFIGIPDSLFFMYKTSSNIASKEFGVNLENPLWSVAESSDGVQWTDVWNNQTNSNSWNEIKCVLSPITRYLKFWYKGNYNAFFKNIQVSEFSQFDADSAIVDFGKHGKKDGIFEEYVAFSHANAAGNVSVSISGEDASAFVVEPATITAGKDIIHTDYVKISYIGTDVKTHSATLIFSDGTTSDSVALTGQRIDKHVPIFTWNPQELPYYYDDTIPNVFSSNTSKDLAEITLDNGQTASIAELLQQTDASYSLIIHSKPQTETPCSITITQAGNDTIESIIETYTFTPRQKPSLVVPFKLTKHDFDAAKTAGHFQSKDGDGNGKLLWVDSAPDSGNDKDWFNNDGEYFRLGGSGTGASVTGPTYHWEDKYIYFEFAGQPDSLFFEYIGYPLATGPDWYVFESATGEGDPMSWSKAWHVSTNTSKNFVSEYKQAAIALKSSTRFICLCYSGNYCGRYKNLYVTAYDGIYYLRNEENKYLSRGEDNGTQAVVDDYGIAVRKTRKTADNVNTYSRFQYIDQYALNKKFLGVNGEKIVSNVSGEFGNQEAVSFVESPIDGTEAIQLQHSDQYLSVGENGQLELGGTEYRWFLEKYTDHKECMQKLKDAQAIMAAEEFKESVPSLAILRQQLRDNDYGKEDVDLSAVYSKDKPQELYDSLTAPNTLPKCSIRVKEGLYHLSLRAFNRMADNESSYIASLQGYDNAVAYVYAKNGDKEYHTQLCSIYSSSENSSYNTSPTDSDCADYTPRYGTYFPNGKTAADSAFRDNNRYENDVYIYVSPDSVNDGLGLLEFGLRSPSNGECMNWVCWQNFTLTRYFRKEYRFDNDKNDNLWSTVGNWLDYQEKRVSSEEDLPRIVHDVRIKAPIIVDVTSGAAHRLTIDKSVNSIVVKSDASLSIGEGGIEIEGENKNVFTLKADSSGQTGVLRMYPGTPAPKATVEFYSTISNDPDSTNWEWQYIGSPITQETVETNEHLFYNCWLYQHDTEKDEWTTAGNWGHMQPFLGYAFTRNDGHAGGGSRASTGPLFTYVGQLNKAEKRDTILLIYKDELHCENHLANSWTAPLQIKNFKEEDFVNVSPTINIYKKEGRGNAEAVAVYTAPYTGNDVVPAMQGFFVKATGTDAKLVLDYERLVWKGDAENKPLQAPARGARESDETDLLSRVCINMLSADSIPDHIYLLEKEGEGFSRQYDAGYDAPKYFVDGLPCIYTYETSGNHLAVSATDDVVGTYLAINTNASQDYTLTFSKVIGEGLGLRDLVTNTIVPITEGMQYAFTAPANSSPILRFVVVEHEETPQWNNNNGTSLEDVGGEFKIWQSGEILSVIGAGSHASLRLYDAAGKLILSEFFNEATAINLNALPTGVYMVQVNDKTEKVLH